MTLSALDTELIKILLWVVADLLVALIAILTKWKERFVDVKKCAILFWNSHLSFYCGYCLFPDCQSDQYHTCFAACSVHLKTWFPFLLWTSPELSLTRTDHPQFHSRYAWGGKGFFTATILQVEVPKMHFFLKIELRAHHGRA